ncbi:MAG: hypothetical protein KZQ87_13890 [Candidatus Thiodiazotropha sp. (ex Cardiolucina cf. quadrata)]|nr:hypothetical protein [Candidatus Thiodiazotropha sp. (ex Cardiolucina cf. quadrata)]
MMWKSSNRSLCIDVRRSVEVLLLGSLDTVDAHIPYIAIDVDEWSEFMKSYRSQSNSAFLLRVDELVIERGLNRSTIVSLMASSYHQGIMAANVLSVAGYENVAVEVGRKNHSAICSAANGKNQESKDGYHARYEWTNSMNRQVGGWVH